MRDFFVHTYDVLLRGGAAVFGFLQGMGTSQHRGVLLLVALMLADFATGLWAALRGKSPKSKTGKLSSAASFAGLVKKAAMLGVLALSYGLDWVLSEGNAMFFTAVLWMYISTEGLSLMENLALCGVPVPARMRSLLERASRQESVTPAQ